MRKVLDILIGAGAAICALAAISVLAGVIGVIAFRGFPAVNWTFLTEHIRLVGAAGGIFWNIAGTLILLVTAFIACAPVALALALLEHTWLKSLRLKRWLRSLLYTLNGLPGIVFGIFGFLVFTQWFGWGKSWLAGGLVLAMMMLPTVTITMIERLRAIPRTYIDAAAALGLNEPQIVWAVLLPHSWGSLLTGSVLGLARAAGETAPIMFTATIFAGATLPSGIRENPVLTLPYHIFILAQDSFDPGVAGKLWGTAFVLVCLVFSLSFATLPSRLKAHDESYL